MFVIADRVIGMTTRTIAPYSISALLYDEYFASDFVTHYEGVSALVDDLRHNRFAENIIEWEITDDIFAVAVAMTFARAMNSPR